MIDNALALMPPEEAQLMRERIMEKIPVGRMGEPLDIANGALFFVSDESTFMTASEPVIDGGFTAC